MFLTYRSPDMNLNFEPTDGISSIHWHADFSYDIQPAGLTTYFLFSQREMSSHYLFLAYNLFSSYGR